MKLRKVIAPILIGTSTLFISQNIQAENQTQITTKKEEIQSQVDTRKAELEKAFKEVKEKQITKLQKLLDLPEEVTSEIKDVLNELSGLYTKHFSIYYYDRPYDEEIIELRKALKEKLLQDAKPLYEKLFQKCLKHLQTNNLKKQEIVRKNLEAFQNVIYSYDISTTMRSVAEASKHSEAYFNERFKDTLDNTNDFICRAHEGLILLDFLDKYRVDTTKYVQKYFSWLEKQTNFVVNQNTNSEKTKALNYALKDAVNKIMTSSYNYFPSIRYADAPKSILPLMRVCTKLTRLNIDDPKTLGNTLDYIFKFKVSYEPTDPKIIKELESEIIKTLKLTFEGISNLSQLEDRTKLLNKMFFYPMQYKIFDISNELQEAMFVEPWTKHYFSKEKNIGNSEEWNMFIDVVLRNGNYLRYPTYTLLKTINNNRDYFLTGTKKLLKGDTVGAIDHERLMEVFVGFNRLQTLDTKNAIEQELKIKVASWSRENIEEPIFQLFLSDFRGVTVNTQEKRVERYFNDTDWIKINEQLEQLVIDNPFFANKLSKVVIDRLSSEKNPHARKMCYETLSLALIHELNDNQMKVVLDTLRQGITNESSPYPVMGIGKLIADGIAYERDELTRAFYKKLDDYSQGKINFNDLINSEELELTPIQTLIIDLLKISGGDMKLIKELTQREFAPPTILKTYRNKITGERTTVPVTSGNKEEYNKDKYYRDDYKTYELIEEKVDRSKQNPENFKILRQTMSNSREALAYAHSSNFRLKNLQYPVQAPAPGDPLDPDNKEKEAKQRIKDCKMTVIRLLENHFGWYTNLDNIGGETAAYIEACSSYGDNISEEKEIMAEKLKLLKSRLFDQKKGLVSKSPNPRTVKLQIAQSVMNSAPSGKRRVYIDYLNQMGFDHDELLDIEKQIEISKIK